MKLKIWYWSLYILTKALYESCSAFVYLTKGRVRKLLKAKLKIGGWCLYILSFITIPSIDLSCTTCYDPPRNCPSYPSLATGRIEFAPELLSEEILVLSKSAAEWIISGTIFDGNRTSYSFRINRINSNSYLQIEDVYSVDLQFDSPEEDFIIKLNKELYDIGAYQLLIYGVPAQDQGCYPNGEHTLATYTLQVIE